MIRDPEELQGEVLRSIVESETWAATIGGWIEEGLSNSLRDVMTTTDDKLLHQAQGKWLALTDIKERIQFALEKAELKKNARLRKMKKSEGIDNG